MRSTNSLSEQQLDLVIKQITEGLTLEEQKRLGEAATVDEERRCLEELCAARQLAAVPPEPLPPQLAAQLRAQAPTPRQPVTRHANKPLVAWFAAAACLLLAILGWLPGQWLAPFQQAGSEPAQRREALLRSADRVQIAWVVTEDAHAQGASGDVVWDNTRQEGYMLFTGLSANQSAQGQYQLWIFDAQRDNRYPINGGVFDIPPDAVGPVIVPIVSRLPVTRPSLFAITLEEPGGVVVSSRERLLLLAEVPP